MARLPVPGSDENAWGDILNDYLGVAHDSGGAIKANAVPSAALQDSSVTNAKLNVGSGSDGQVLTKDALTAGGFKWAPSSGASPATSGSLGTVQLAGDLGGTATAPTVPALANKANTSTTITAGTGLTGGGDLSTNRTLTVAYGTTAGTAAQGNDSRITGAEQTVNKGAANGYAPLGSDSLVPVANLPKVFPPATLTDAATIATNASLSNHFRVTLGDNRTLGAPTNPTDGQKVMWEFIQDGTGGRTITLDAIFGLGSDITAVTLSTAAGARDFMGAVYNATAAKWYVIAFVKGY